MGAVNKYQMKELYHHIFDGEIYQKSQCIWHENVLLDGLRSCLVNLGYNSVSASRKVWQRDSKQVVTCPVDDFTTCSHSTDDRVSRLFDPDTVVITDNHVSCPTVYTVHQLPTSFYGIYAYQPQQREWQPDRRFNLAINRLDIKRMILMLEYRKRLPWHDGREVMDYVNFNCWAWDGDNSSVQGLRTNFMQQWSLLDPVQQDAYQAVMDRDLPPMPWRNHDLDLEPSLHRAWLNLVVETYSSDSVIALSEKTFRALVTPVPWMLYAGRHAVVYLESLGFDCLTDVVPHGYDDRTETKTADYGDKCVDWFWMAQENYARLQDLDFAWLQQRCREAADHNRDLLRTMRQQWPTQQAHWWSQLVTEL